MIPQPEPIIIPIPQPTTAGFLNQNNPLRALQFLNLPKTPAPTQEQLWEDFKQYGDLEYTQRIPGSDIADVVFKEAQSAQNARDNFDTTKYGANVTLRFIARQPPPYDPSVTRDIQGKTGSRFAYYGPDRTQKPPNKKGGILDTFRSISKK